MANLTRAVDVPFDDPPAAVETWNAADLHDFPETDASTSIHPRGARLVDGAFVRDAYLELFAVDPSTVARLRPNETTRFVGAAGRVLATLDYRVALPSSNDTTWSLVSDDVENVTLLVDGAPVATTSGTHTPVLSFENLTLGTHTLTVSATIRVRLRESACAGNDTACASPRVLATPTETVTVSDSTRVTRYSLAPTVARSTAVDGTSEFAVSSTTPWAGFTTSGGRVQGAWAFYSARDTAWDSLVVSTATDETTRPSPLHPLVTSAYPRASGATTSGDLTLVGVDGTETRAPVLPPNVSLDTPATYTASRTLVVQAPDNVSAITVRGFVSGSNETVSVDSLPAVERRPSRLTLARVTSPSRTVTLRVSLADAATGAPIDTNASGGAVTLDGERVETNATGTATRTVARTSGARVARYTPEPWWNATTNTTYLASGDTLYVRGTRLASSGVLTTLGIAVGLVGLAGFFVERSTGWRLWRR